MNDKDLRTGKEKQNVAHIFSSFLEKCCFILFEINKKVLAALKNVLSCNMHINKNKVKIGEKARNFKYQNTAQSNSTGFLKYKGKRGIRKIQRKFSN